MEDYNPTKKKKILIVFHDIIADMESNKKLIWFFLRGINLNVALVFLSQSYFKVLETKILHATH